MDLQDFKEKIKDVIQLNKGGSYKLAVDIISYTRLLKYVRQDQYKKIKPRFKKISDPVRLKRFVEIGVFEENQNVYKATKETTKILTDSGYNILLFPKIFDGIGSINETNNTDVFIEAIKLPDYFYISYPSFDFLKPDAMLIRKRKDKIILHFLEIENEKTLDWQLYIEKKILNYKKLARLEKPYNHFVTVSKHLQLNIIPKERFKFSVIFIGNNLPKINTNEGFIFTEKLCQI